MNWTLRQLTAFLSVAHTGSFTGAAKVMCLTQGAVSLLIRELEEVVGLKLFDRTSRSVRLSPSGEVFLPFARKIIEDQHQASRYMHDLRSLKNAIVTIAAAPLVACTVLPRMLAGFSQLYPEVRVIPVDVPMAQVQQYVARGDAELGFGPERVIDYGIRGVTLFTAPVSIVCRTDHRFVGVRNTWENLGSEPLIIVGRESIDYISMNFGGAVSFNVALVVNHMATALSMAGVGMGVVLAAPFVKTLAQSYGLTLAELATPVLQRNFAIYHHAERSLSPAGQAFVDFMHEFVRQQEQGNFLFGESAAQVK